MTKQPSIRFLLIKLFFLFVGYVNAANMPISSLKQDSTLWEGIAPFFSPPDSLKGQLGDFRSPLQFYDGTWVKTKDDWQRRRKEILKQWHGLMGKWPPLMEQQKLIIDSSIRKEGYVQHHVRFKWLPNEWTDGYLLIPDADDSRKHPAVITVFYEPETAVGIGGKPRRDFARQLVKRGFVTL